GTSASNSISSAIRAIARVFGQLISSTPSMVEIAQPRSRFCPNVPSLSLRSLNSGLVDSDTGDNLRPVLQHSHLMPGANVHAELAVAGGLHRLQAVDQLGTRAGEGEGANNVAGNDVVLFRAQEHQVPAVVREITCVRRLVLLIDLTI